MAKMSECKVYLSREQLIERYGRDKIFEYVRLYRVAKRLENPLDELANEVDYTVIQDELERDNVPLIEEKTMNNRKPIELLPCPLCGKKPFYYDSKREMCYYYDQAEGKFGGVECECGLALDDWLETFDSVDKWNRRYTKE